MSTGWRREFASDKTLLRLAAPALVGAAEAKLRGEPVDPAVIDDIASAMRAMPGGERIDTLVLACTHFPLLADELARAFGPGVALVDGSDGIARRIASLTQGQAFARSRPDLALFTRSDPGLSPLKPALERRGLGRTAGAVAANHALHGCGQCSRGFFDKDRFGPQLWTVYRRGAQI